MEHPTDEDSFQPADLSAGYHVDLHVHPDGTFRVLGPEPHAEAMPEDGVDPSEGADPSEAGEPLPNIGAALKAVLQIVKDNPIGESEQQNFEAGYASGPHRM